ncbi:MAG: DUF2975 domain-containing protein [Chthoniobacterales bacterium]|jgi:hypothetical protein|nr:DUF2975 domain-containing protein [Chthoniobacterales bacterium]
MANPTNTSIQQRSANLRRLVSCLLASLVVLLVLERFGALAMQLSKHGIGGEWPRRFASECITAFPEILYLLALWWIREALAAFAAGKLYTPTVTRMLERVGVMLSTGAFIGVFLLPSATGALGFGPGYVIAYDISGLVLGAIGLSLNIIAHVLQRASELQAELDEIF